MAKAYGLLPSEVRSRGTLYDIKVTEALVAWEHKITTEASTGTPKLSVNQMQAMMERVKNEKRKQQHHDAA